MADNEGGSPDGPGTDGPPRLFATLAMALVCWLAGGAFLARYFHLEKETKLAAMETAARDRTQSEALRLRVMSLRDAADAMAGHAGYPAIFFSDQIKLQNRIREGAQRARLDGEHFQLVVVSRDVPRDIYLAASLAEMVAEMGCQVTQRTGKPAAAPMACLFRLGDVDTAAGASLPEEVRIFAKAFTEAEIPLEPEAWHVTSGGVLELQVRIAADPGASDKPPVEEGGR